MAEPMKVPLARAKKAAQYAMPMFAISTATRFARSMTERKTKPLSFQIAFSRPMSAATNCRPFITVMPTTRQCCGWRLAGSLLITTAMIRSQATGPCENTQLFLMCPNALSKYPALMLLPCSSAYLPGASPKWQLIGAICVGLYASGWDLHGWHPFPAGRGQVLVRAS